ncbi:2'-5' RNA ligase [Mesobacillus persicus]|uniref:RNA 2',3'-cyclic phosphodiesterase n=1 Tax=Mesobacillus persicus TaxID=930146 RepID=A0A1H7Y0I0_9BACI|nr:RNA 2',3'-cyclic phosphodiesterase [Mesobacillus persicus]SEM39435.1 2'-5' RNA ligase [Mesobacillus persicus]
MTQTNQHYFYALELPQELKAELDKTCGILQEALPFKRWVHHQDLHITLAFLGHANEEQLAISMEKLNSRIQCPSFELTIDHLGVFGKSDSPRIFWTGVKHAPLLHQARDEVYSACLDSGFKLETRPFKPHITLARKWSNDFPFETEMLEKQNPFNKRKFVFQANNVVLYKTHLGKEPKYEALARFPLSGN